MRAEFADRPVLFDTRLSIGLIVAFLDLRGDSVAKSGDPRLVGAVSGR